MYLRTNKHTLLLFLTLGLSAPAFAVVTSGEGGAVPNIDTSITGAVEQELMLPLRTAPMTAVSRQSSSLPLDRYDHELGVTTFRWNREAVQAPSFNGVDIEERSRYAATYYLEHMTGVGSATKKQDERAVLMSFHDMGHGPIIAKFSQEIFGVEVFNREVNVLMDRDLNMVAASGYFSTINQRQKSTPKLRLFGSQESAFSSALSDLSGERVNASLLGIDKRGKFDVATLSTDRGLELRGLSRAKRVYFPGISELHPAHYVEVGVVHPGSGQEMLYSYVIDRDGEVLFRRNLVENEAYDYTVFGRDADKTLLQGPHGDVIPKIGEGPDPSDIVDMTVISIDSHASLSTQDPWIPGPTSVLEGNNVLAYGDITGGDGKYDTDISPLVTAPGVWDYTYDPVNGATKDNYKAAVVNLFYMNNYLHDWWYDHGFDEQSYNAQFTNYDRGGIGGDPLVAQGQDSSGFNNANMYTPADGASPRMQQYLFFSKDADYGDDWGLTVTSHPEIGLMPFTRPAMFGPQVYAPLSGNIVIPVDGDVSGGGTGDDACQAVVNIGDVAGNIALVSASTVTSCGYATQAQNVAAAGAIALIIVVEDSEYVLFGDVEPDVIPTVGISSTDIAAVMALVEAGEPVTAELFSNGALKDSTFDNGIIAHEWGHYIQNRLVGNANGLVNFQGRAMGEGWSDFHALMFMLRESHSLIEGNSSFESGYTVSTHVANFTNSVRRAPYTVDMATNPLTFTHIQDGAQPDGLSPTSNGSPHAAGEMWASVLWDVYVRLLNTYDFDEAEGRMADYLVAGYKMTPIAPTYTEARDAILAAMYANERDDYVMALEAFARRGMGLGAVSPARGAYPLSGVTESYLSQLATYETTNFELEEDFDGLVAGFCSRDGVLDVGETGTISFDVSNAGSEFLSSVRAQAVVTSNHDVTIENNGLVEFSNLDLFETVSSPELKVVLNSAGTADTLTMELQFLEVEAGDDTVEPAPIQLSTVVNYDFAAQPLVGDQAVEDMEDVSFFATFEEQVLYEEASPAEGTQRVDTANVDFFQQFTAEPLGNQIMLLLNNPYPTDVAVETTEITVGDGDDFSISFWHFYWIEADWDGGVVEVSIDGGEWQDATDAGGEFAIGYPSSLLALDQSALAGRPAYTGRSDADSFEGVRETISFGSALNGSLVRFRFRIASDYSVAEYGWWIDNVTASNIASPMLFETVAGDSVVCDNSLPRVALDRSGDSTQEGGAVQVSATATDRNASDVLSYSWVQVSGPAAELSGSDSLDVTITSPRVKDTEMLVFDFTVDDGSGGVVTERFSLEVTNIPPALVVSGSEGPLDEGSAAAIAVEVTNGAEDDEYTYEWIQISGTAATVTGQSTANLAVTLPRIAQETDALVFNVSVSDGVDTTVEEYSLTAVNIAPTTSVSLDQSSVQEGEPVAATVTVTNAAVGENYTYSWTQVSGTTASISGRTLTSATITTPKVNATETLRFDVIVSDGVVNVSTPFSITVQNKASSGGSFGWLALGLMALLGLRGRRLFSRAT